MKTLQYLNSKITPKASIIRGMAFVLFLLSVFTSMAGLKPIHDSLVCLEIQGKILMQEGDLSTDDCIIELINNQGDIDSLILKNNKLKFKFKLARNSSYAIRVSRKGYLSKYVSVNTDMTMNTDDENGDVIHRFIFETPLLKKDATAHLNREAMDLPIAIIHFDNKKRCFNYNKEYTASIKKELRRGRSVERQDPLITSNTRELATAYSK